MMTVNAFALIAETDDGAGPVRYCDVKRGDQEKPAQHCYHDAQAEKIMKVLG